MENRGNTLQSWPGTGGLLLGIVIGALAGGIAVMLYAPKSGPETRAQIRHEVAETQKMLQNWSNDLRERVNSFSQIVRFQTGEEVQVGGDGQQRVN